MHALDLQCNHSLDHRAPDPPAMSDHSSQIQSSNNHSSKSPENEETHVVSSTNSEDIKGNNVKNSTSSRNNGFSSLIVRRERPSRACTQRAAARLQATAEAEAAVAEAERKKKKAKRRERLAARLLKEDSEIEEGSEEAGEGDGREEENGELDGSSSLLRLQHSKIVTPLVGEPEASQLPRWRIRSMWQLASILSFLNVFRPLLNLKVEFSAEELETALLTPNKTLADVHMPLMKAIPPVTRMALGHATWITVLCRKLRDWWHWVAEGDLPIVVSHGTEVEAYSTLDPGIRVVILKALCDIRVEQEDIRNYIDDSIKHGAKMSAFRKERMGGDSLGTSYWYEDDPIIGHRLYREIRKVELKKGKGKSIPSIPHSSYQWETVATNLDEFQNVSEKLFSSTNRTEVSVGKKLKNEMLAEIEKVHKRKEKLLKKQHRQALMLESMMSLDGLGGGRSLRDRKPVTYTFDDYDRSINEALKVTKKKQESLEACEGKDPLLKHGPATNGEWAGPSHNSQFGAFSALSPKSPDGDESYDDQRSEMLDRSSNRHRRRPERYSAKEFVEAVSDNDADFDSDDDIVGEVVYDEEYLRKRKKRSMSSSAEGDEEYHMDDEIHEEEEEEEEDENLSTSEEDSGDGPQRFRSSLGRTRRETKLRLVGRSQSGLRRSKRSTRPRINYRQYEVSESDTEALKPDNPTSLYVRSVDNDDAESSTGSDDDSDEKVNLQETDPKQFPAEKQPETYDHKVNDPPPEQANNFDQEEFTDQEEAEGARKRRFLDLNELAPGSGFDDGPNLMGDENKDEI